MADNVTLPGAGVQVATDDVAGVQFQRIKLDAGAEGSSMPVSADNPLPVVVSGGATEATLASVLAKLGADPATQTTLAAVLAKLSGDPATQATLAAVLDKLPADPSTATKQDAIVAALGPLATQTTAAAILAKLSSEPATDSGLAAIASLLTTQTGYLDGLESALAAILAKLVAAPATEAKQDAGNTALGSIATAIGTTNAKLDTQATYLDGVEGSLSSILAKIIAAPATEAKQDTLTTAVASTNTKLDTIAGYVDGLEGFVDGLEGLTGALTETAPASDTASSGLNGRLQRIAQRLTSLIALLPASLGAKASSASLSVCPSTDGIFVTRSNGAVTDASSTITTGGTSQQAVASNTSRKFLFILNPPDATESLFVNLGSAASTTAKSSIELQPGQSWTFGDFIPTDAVNVNAATTGHAFTVKHA